jgi:chemotaxis protein histidine kinase CheA
MMAPPPPMFVHQHIPMMQPAPPPMLDPHALRAQRLGEQLLAEEFAEMHLHRHRSHSRGRSPSDRLRWDLEQQRRDAAAAESLRRHNEETAALKAQFELDRRREEAAAAHAKHIREEEATALKLKLELEAQREAAKRAKQEADAAAERQRVIDEHERKLAADAKAALDAEAAFKLKLELQAHEEKERERKAYDDFLRKQREKEIAEEQAYREALRKQKEKEEAKEREYQAFLRLQKEKQEAEEKAKKEEQARIDSSMRARLEKSGWSQHDIEIALDPEKAEKEKKKKKKHRYSGDVYLDDDIIVVGGGGPPTLPDAPPLSVGFPQHHVPVFPRINRKFLDIETLEHYHVPWEWDRVSFSSLLSFLPFIRFPLQSLTEMLTYANQANSEFIILLRELDKYETDVLFEHTRRRRQGSSAPLLIDKVKDSGPKFAWVRHKSKERSKSRGKDIRVTEIVRR